MFFKTNSIRIPNLWIGRMDRPRQWNPSDAGTCDKSIRSLRYSIAFGWFVWLHWYNYRCSKRICNVWPYVVAWVSGLGSQNSCRHFMYSNWTRRWTSGTCAPGWELDITFTALGVPRSIPDIPSTTLAASTHKTNNKNARFFEMGHFFFEQHGPRQRCPTPSTELGKQTN